MVESFTSTLRSDSHLRDWLHEHSLSADPYWSVPIIDNLDLAKELYSKLSPPDFLTGQFSFMTARQDRFTRGSLAMRKKREPYCDRAEGDYHEGWNGFSNGYATVDVAQEMLPIKKLTKLLGLQLGTTIRNSNRVFFKYGGGENTGLTILDKQPFITSPVVVAGYRNNSNIHWIYDIDRFKRNQSAETDHLAPGFVWQIRSADLPKDIPHLISQRINL